MTGAWAWVGEQAGPQGAKVGPLDLWSMNPGSRQHHGSQKQEEEEPPHCYAPQQHRQSPEERLVRTWAWLLTVLRYELLVKLRLLADL